MTQPHHPTETLHQTPAPECEPWAAEYVEAMLSTCQSDIYEGPTLIEAAWENTPFDSIPEDVRTALHQALSVRPGVEWLDYANAYRVMWADTEEGVRYAAMVEDVDKLLIRLRESIGSQPFTEKTYIEIAKQMGVFRDGNAEIGRFKRLVGFHQQITWIDDRRMCLVPAEAPSPSPVAERTARSNTRKSGTATSNTTTSVRATNYGKAGHVTQDLRSLTGEALYEALMERTKAPAPQTEAKVANQATAGVRRQHESSSVVEATTALPPAERKAGQVGSVETEAEPRINPEVVRKFLQDRTSADSVGSEKAVLSNQSGNTAPYAGGVGNVAKRPNPRKYEEGQSPRDIEFAECVELLQSRFTGQKTPKIFTYVAIRNLTFAARVSESRKKVMADAIQADPRFNQYEHYGLFVFVPDSMDEAQKASVLEEYFDGMARAEVAATKAIERAATTSRFSHDMPLPLQSALIIARDELDNPVKDVFRGAFIHFLRRIQGVIYDDATGVIARKPRDDQQEREGKSRPWLAT